MEGTRMHPEREFEIGRDEAWFTNVKMLVEETLKHLSELSAVAGESARRSSDYATKVLADTHESTNFKNNVANQALQNAVETANMVAKNAIKHGEVATDRIWNVDEVSTLTAKSGVQADTIVAIMADLVAEALTKKTATP